MDNENIVKPSDYKLSISGCDLSHGDFHALKNVSLNVAPNEVTAFIGPSGCGKSTLLKSINRMNDLVEGCGIHGENFSFDGIKNVCQDVEITELRRRMGHASAQKPNPFSPMSIYDNIAYGPRTHGIRRKADLE